MPPQLDRARPTALRYAPHSRSLPWLGALFTLLIVLLPGAVAGADDSDWLPGDYVDYAPSGMPDFSQCRSAWSQPGSPPQWTHAAPVALANALWWLDSAAEQHPAPPAQAQDSHGLVTAYPVFGPARDDHAVENLGPLVLDLAGRLGTNAAGRRGTAWPRFEPALRRYLSGRSLDANYRIEHRLAPTAEWLREGVALRSGLVLLLGVWEEQGPVWRRVGGHYVSLAGMEPSAVLLADPLADEAGRIGRGRAIPSDPSRHSCREAPSAHDDAAVVSHDRYALATSPALPGGALVLDGYFVADRYGEAAAFQSQNPLGEAAPVPWLGGPVVMAIDAALALRPRENRLPTASLVPSSTATPSATPSATVLATRGSPTVPPSPRPAASGTPLRPAPAWLPWLGAGGSAQVVGDTVRGARRPSEPR